MTMVPSRRIPPVKQLDTRARIVQSSIALFNQKGIQNVTLRHISADAKISIGNLTYYFKRKNDLIRATLEVLRDRLSVALARPVNAGPVEFGVEYLLRVYTTFWEFRFYFNALAYLLNRDRLLRDEYYEFRDWLLDTVESDLSDLNKQGLWGKPRRPNSYRLQAENIWRLWLSWLRMYQLDNLSTKIHINDALYDCALHHWSLCQGWLTPQYSRELLKRFQQILLPDKSNRGDVKQSKSGT